MQQTKLNIPAKNVNEKLLMQILKLDSPQTEMSQTATADRQAQNTIAKTTTKQSSVARKSSVADDLTFITRQIMLHDKSTAHTTVKVTSKSKNKDNKTPLPQHNPECESQNPLNGHVVKVRVLGLCLNYYDSPPTTLP